MKNRNNKTAFYELILPELENFVSKLMAGKRHHFANL